MMDAFYVIHSLIGAHDDDAIMQLLTEYENYAMTHIAKNKR